jgi:hypothetical protein
MKITYGGDRLPLRAGLGVDVELSGDEVATAVRAYLLSHGVYVQGPSTVTVNGELCREGRVYVDPVGCVLSGGHRFTPRGVEG